MRSKTMIKATKNRIKLVAAITAAAGLFGVQVFAETPKPGETVSAELAGRPLQQIAITTSNLPTAIEFYGNRLGLPFLFESNGMAFFDMAGIRLMVAHDAERTVERPAFVLYFEVDDFHAAVDRLIAAELDLDGPIETVQRSAAGELKIQQFRDPDGNALALIGHVQSE